MGNINWAELSLNSLNPGGGVVFAGVVGEPMKDHQQEGERETPLEVFPATDDEEATLGGGEACHSWKERFRV